jgi:DNA-binding GntR family transcriptional regulator
MRPIDDLGGFDCPTPGNPADSEPTAYNRIATALADRIASGVYATGCRLPSGSELCREFGVSPMTVRRALAVLDNQGLISGEKGRGVFARSVDLGDSAFRLDSLTGDWLDESAEIRLLSAEMTRADERVARILAVAQGERVVYLRRLVLHEGNPVMYHTEYIRSATAAGRIPTPAYVTTRLPRFGTSAAIPARRIDTHCSSPRRRGRRNPGAGGGGPGSLPRAHLSGKGPHTRQLGLVSDAGGVVQATSATGTGVDTD